ncbi:MULTISPECIES: aminodeoxychorismate synthase component I [unclassified Aureimonas]|uniref:aminodeoxychorismate synthase component I n=1 Tax=unclassified Aureimonas TaxID=2615206 RepID=UPI000701D43C|nr:MULTISPECIES: aminodeoxychorismate synthase component I [unclassified Aureimonas]KQT64097.1 aminobenzoate synthetase [Aureimonas sp. Leaf427]KQT81287.1 aminobenzoate synthetase [Aureimonas sp. Leaf460]
MWQTRIDFLDPAEAAEKLRPLGGLAFLDSAMRHETLGRMSYVAASPFQRFTVDGTGAMLDGVRLPGPPLERLREVLARFPVELLPSAVPFQGGAIGAIGYDFAHHLERLDPPPGLDAGTVVLRLALYDTIVAFDHEAGTADIFASGHPAEGVDARRERAERRMAEVAAALAGPAPARPPMPETAPDWRSSVTRESYAGAIETIRDYILAGDIYQANFAQAFQAALPAGFDPFAFYRRLRAANPAPFAAFLEDTDLAVCSSSPERFLKLSGRSVETRPIKGTAPRSADPAEDVALGAALLSSEKDRAENVMIVDLLRNDIARVCLADSVEVPVLCGLETYASVHHLVSVVTGELKPGADGLDLLAASFPGGSITGAPKIRAMDIITELEGRPRGVYCGSIGWIGFDGALDLNIAIRTVTIENGTATLQAGGGITVLSEPEAEYEETLAKAARVFSAFEAAR